jgi:energy-coupling factor transporter ATP-binding protein EcfA2
VLRLDGVRFTHAGAPEPTLRNVSLALDDGAITGLAGASETGKTTLGLVAAGLAPRVTGGSLGGGITIDGEDATRWPMGRYVRSIGLGLQDSEGQLSMATDTVFEEVAVGASTLGLDRDELIRRCWTSLDQLDIKALASRAPGSLSGGEMQLVGIAGLLAMRTRHLVLDEPFAHLDRRGIERLEQALRTATEAGVAILLIEQRTDVLLRMCDQVSVIGHGTILEQGAPSTVLSNPTVRALGVAEPDVLRVAGVVGAIGGQGAVQ